VAEEFFDGDQFEPCSSSSVAQVWRRS
jgi:hypothetical protein